MSDETAEIEPCPPVAPPMTELQRIARDSLRSAVALCDAAGPTTVTIYVQRRRHRPNSWARVETIDLPQIRQEITGTSAPRKRQT